MTAIIKIREEEHEVRGDRPLYRILEDMELSTQAYLAIREGVLLTEDERVANGDIVELIAVVSGG